MGQSVYVQRRSLVNVLAVDFTESTSNVVTGEMLHVIRYCLRQRGHVFDAD